MLKLIRTLFCTHWYILIKEINETEYLIRCAKCKDWHHIHCPNDVFKNKAEKF